MKKHLFYLILIFAFKSELKAQIQKSLKIAGLYKLYSKTYAKDSVFRGYINFYNDNQYYFFGTTAYNAMGTEQLTFSMFSNGIWSINKLNIISIKDNKLSTPVIVFNKPDSMSYQATLREPFDTIFFNIEVFDDSKKILPNELIYFSSINRLVESNSNGSLKYSYGKNAKNLSEQISFIGHEPLYPTTIKINPDFNYHTIKVYLKRIRQNGYVQDKVYPLNLSDSLIRLDDNLVTFKKSSLYKATREEALNYINEVQKSNSYFYKEFIEIKKLLLK